VIAGVELIDPSVALLFMGIENVMMIFEFTGTDAELFAGDVLDTIGGTGAPMVVKWNEY
jgi:hypothetical protein